MIWISHHPLSRDPPAPPDPRLVPTVPAFSPSTSFPLSPAPCLARRLPNPPGPHASETPAPSRPRPLAARREGAKGETEGHDGRQRRREETEMRDRNLRRKATTEKEHTRHRVTPLPGPSADPATRKGLAIGENLTPAPQGMRAAIGEPRAALGTRLRVM